ncbi:MFS transporter [Microlunatus soli]|uniref:Putative proline/betaine transporter n=1 Tax=Microlunatus soli TaxID=630515 RepID=A0A1H1WRD7_9ACTN|nr:MFS transporter [Microlunatus soli]SDS99828.1 MFS transporter, MHS family, alpha-ketoglutarate permease [Microlunatus soli]
MSVDHPAGVRPAQARGPRQIIAASIGNLAEWYDWYVYSFLTAYFAPQIFPGHDRLAQTLSSFAVFAVGFFLRPIGGLVVGALADRWGRRNTLTLTILAMGAASLIIAVVPTYSSIGIGAPIILVFARLVSGLSIGGEFAANTTFLVESAPEGRRGFYSSFQYVSTTIGQLIASGLSAILVGTLSDDAMNSWGWRIGFVVGGLIALVGLWIRRSAVETHAPSAERRPGLFEAIVRYPKQSLMIIGVTVAGTISYYTWTTYLPNYAEQNKFDPGKALIISTISLAFFTLLQPVAGALSDRIGRKPLLIIFSGAFALGIVPALALIRSGPSFAGYLAISLLGMILLSGFTSISAAVNAEIIPGHVRAAGIGFPYSLTVALFGGTAPVIGTAMAKAGHAGLFGWWVAVLCVVSLVVYLIMPETHRRPLQE